MCLRLRGEEHRNLDRVRALGALPPSERTSSVSLARRCDATGYRLGASALKVDLPAWRRRRECVTMSPRATALRISGRGVGRTGRATARRRRAARLWPRREVSRRVWLALASGAVGLVAVPGRGWGALAGRPGHPGATQVPTPGMVCSSSTRGSTGPSARRCGCARKDLCVRGRSACSRRQPDTPQIPTPSSSTGSPAPGSLGVTRRRHHAHPYDPVTKIVSATPPALGAR